MKRLLLALLPVSCLAIGLSTTSPQTTTSAKVISRLDPLLDPILSVDAKLEVLKDDYFGSAEGPLWVSSGADGYLLFSDLAANSIYKWTPDGTLSVFLEKAGFTGTDASRVGRQRYNGRLTVIVLGSNGLTLDPQGRLLIAANGDRSIVRLDKSGARVTLADRYQGKRFSGPNDLVAKSNGSIYFTDYYSGLRDGDSDPARELPYHGVFLIKDSQVLLLDKDPQGGLPNGITFSPDERHLYVNSGNRFIVRYDVQSDDTITNGTVFIKMSGDAPGAADGMKVDTRGNVFCTGPGGVWIISSDGKHIGTILVPESRTTTNLAFGDADRKSLYITNRRSVFRIRVNTPGILPGPRQ